MRFRDFLRGYGSVLTLFPTDHEEVAKLKIRRLSDQEAIAAAWKTVGDAMYDAIDTLLGEKQSYDANNTHVSKSH